MVTDPTSGALVATAVSQTKAQTDNVTRFRYEFTSGDWAPGTATITIPTWKDSGGDVAPEATLNFEVLGPTVQLVQPTNGSGIDVNTINGRTYVDVAVTVPSYAPAGSTIDWAAISSGAPIVTLSGPGVGSATIDTSQAVAIIGQTPTSGTVRYAIAGSLAASGDVYATYVTGAPPLIVDLGVVTGGTVPVEVDQGAQTIDVPFPVGTHGPATRLPGRHRLARRLQPVHARRQRARDGHGRPVVHARRRRQRLHRPLPRDRRARKRRRRRLRDVRARHVVGGSGERRVVDGE